ncbi:Pc16g05990 [Penicillium rubens Wisconsin 54-1255]|uniref:Pc16g05990 protein n=1 Tax=Penicillium rubens (strain ATCC 28089 / DSM 1075 / NRRL 1951 / Wisconsin 54-1255) TaxID=500485 RepID=B6H8I2_PENRW|nr:Pc16g05990 [Penicillium rubens Wisconsin 54-1255]
MKGIRIRSIKPKILKIGLVNNLIFRDLYYISEAIELILREIYSISPTRSLLVATIQAIPTTPVIPSLVIPSLAISSLAMPSLAIPSLAIPSLAIPSLAMPSPAILAYKNRLAYIKKYREIEATRKAAKEAAKEVTMIVIFYIQEGLGETNIIPDALISIKLRAKQVILNIDSFVRDFFVIGLPSIVDFRPEWTDKFYLAKDMQYIKGKYSPRWISGVDDTFDGTIKELINKLPAPTKVATLIGVEPVRAEPVRAEPVRAEPVRSEPVRSEPVRRKRARSPVTTPPRRSQRRRRESMEKGFIFILERVNLPKTGDICICMGEKGFIFMLERVNLPKTGDACICMGEKGFIFMPDRVNMVEKGFIFMLERVNLPKTGDICICMG